MAGYDSKKFSSNFSDRTKKNLVYIERIVSRDELVSSLQQSFVDKYDAIFKEIDALEETINDARKAIKQLPATKKKGKDDTKQKMFSAVSKLETEKNKFEKALDEIRQLISDKPENLFEVTQLLNSLMGIAVLPYEMHKEVIEMSYYRIKQMKKDDEGEDDIKDAEKKLEIKKSILASYSYSALKEEVLKLHQEGKWVTTYKKDLAGDGGETNEEIALHFLKHLRNAVCHSGDNAISILPLEEGLVIKEILFYDKFYDKNEKKITGEFAMKLSVEELRRLIDCVADFYCNSEIGELDKTETIKNAEKTVNELLS